MKAMRKQVRRRKGEGQDTDRKQEKISRERKRKEVRDLFKK